MLTPTDQAPVMCIHRAVGRDIKQHLGQRSISVLSLLRDFSNSFLTTKLNDMLALRQNLRLAVRPARTLTAGRGYVTKREVAEEIKEDKEGWTENSEVSREP